MAKKFEIVAAGRIFGKDGDGGGIATMLRCPAPSTRPIREPFFGRATVSNSTSTRIATNIWSWRRAIRHARFQFRMRVLHLMWETHVVRSRILAVQSALASYQSSAKNISIQSRAIQRFKYWTQIGAPVLWLSLGGRGRGNCYCIAWAGMDFVCSIQTEMVIHRVALSDERGNCIFNHYIFALLRFFSPVQCCSVRSLYRGNHDCRPE